MADITNSALAQKLDQVATGWQNFVSQQINYLTSTAATVTLTVPYDPTTTVTVMTPVELERVVMSLVAPATGALAEADAHLTEVEQLVADAESSFAGIDQKIATADGLVADAQAAATSAAADASLASTKASQAATSASNAAGSATNAATSATNAAASATAAETAKNVAMTQRARTWYRGVGAPGTISGQLANDLYLNDTTGDVYELQSNGTTWTVKLNLKGPKGDTGATGPQGPAGSDASSITASELLTKLKTVDGSTSGLDADLLDGQDSAYYLAWLNLTGKPTAFTPVAHTHAWGDITSPPVQATRWPTWTEVTSKPTTFAPSAHVHAWADITTGVPETATRWPAWAEVTGKPGTFVPSAHSHIKSEVGLGNVDNTSDLLKPVSNLQQAALDLKADTSAVSTILAHGIIPIDDPITSYPQGFSYGYASGATRNMLTMRHAGDNRVMQLLTSTVGGTSVPVLEVRTSHSTSGGWTSRYAIHHTGNFDPASKLDATAQAADSAKLQGRTYSDSNVGSTIAGRNGSGDIVARLFRTEYTSTNSSPAYFLTQNATGAGADNYARPSTAAQVKTYLGIDNKLDKTGDSMSGGLNFGAAVAASEVDLSRHVQLHTAGYGFSITSYNFNYVAAVSGNHSFYLGATLHMRLDTAGDLVRKNANSTTMTRQPRIFVQSGDPGAAAATGDLWIW